MEFLQKQLKNLKENLKKYLDKRNQMTRSGAAAESLPKFKYFEQMRLLHEKSANKPTVLCSGLRGFTPTHITPVLSGWSLATITCVKLSVGPITNVESYGQVHKSWRTGSRLPFGNCKCYYLYFVKC